MWFGGDSMSDESIPHLRFLIAGKLHRDFIVLPDGQAVNDVLGGSLIYSAVGAAIWEQSIGLLGRIREDIPPDWITKISQKGMDIRGVHPTPAQGDSRHFTGFIDMDTRTHREPFAQYSRANLPFPKELLGYIHNDPVIDSRTQSTPFTLRLSDIPTGYLDCTAAHLAPLDFLSHSLLPPAFRQGSINTITMDPSSSYMNPAFWDDIPGLLKGITAFLCSEEKLRSLFQGRSSDPWEMAEALAGYGCEMIVIKRGSRGQYLYDHRSRARWVIPAYPAKAVNPVGVGDAFCGGFLAAYRTKYNPFEAALAGNISASLVIEGTSPFYALDALPALASARLEFLRNTVRKA